MFIHVNFITVFPDGMDSESVSCIASFVTQRALVTEATDVGLNMFLDCVSQLGAVMALGTLPHGFT